MDTGVQLHIYDSFPKIMRLADYSRKSHLKFCFLQSMRTGPLFSGTKVGRRILLTKGSKARNKD